MSKIKKMREKHKSLMLIKMEREAFFSARPFLFKSMRHYFPLKRTRGYLTILFFLSLSPYPLSFQAYFTLFLILLTLFTLLFYPPYLPFLSSNLTSLLSHYTTVLYHIKLVLSTPLLHILPSPINIQVKRRHASN